MTSSESSVKSRGITEPSRWQRLKKGICGWLSIIRINNWVDAANTQRGKTLETIGFIFVITAYCLFIVSFFVLINFKNDFNNLPYWVVPSEAFTGVFLCIIGILFLLFGYWEKLKH